MLRVAESSTSRRCTTHWWRPGRRGGTGCVRQRPCTDSPLFTLDNVVATPHLGASTDEAQEKAGIAVAKSVRQALAGELVPDAVNVRGGVIAEQVRPFIDLAEHLGHIATSMAPSAVAQLTVEALGEISAFDVNVLELAVLKGMFSVLIDDPVSYVNAPVLAADRGVETALVTEGDSEDHRSLVRVRMACADGQSMVVAGTVFGARDNEAGGGRRLGPRSAGQRAHVGVPLRRQTRCGGYGRSSSRRCGHQYREHAGLPDSAGGLALVALTVDSAVTTDLVEAISAQIGAVSGTAIDLV